MSPSEKADFLSVCQVHNGQQRAYLLKNKELTAPTKGVVHLEIEVIYNTVSKHSVPGFLWKWVVEILLMNLRFFSLRKQNHKRVLKMLLSSHFKDLQ